MLHHAERRPRGSRRHCRAPARPHTRLESAGDSRAEKRNRLTSAFHFLNYKICPFDDARLWKLDQRIAILRVDTSQFIVNTHRLREGLLSFFIGRIDLLPRRRDEYFPVVAI